MVFQHYTTDDFVGHEGLLNKPFTRDNIRAVIEHLDPNLCLRKQTVNDVTWWDITIDKFGKEVVFNCTFSEILFHENGFHHPEFVDMNTWIYHEGLPIIADTYILREDHPELNEIICDRKAAQYLYQLTYGISNDDPRTNQ